MGPSTTLPQTPLRHTEGRRPLFILVGFHVEGLQSPRRGLEVANMDLLENTTHAFVVRFWREGDAPGHTKWLGHITHVPSGDNAYGKTHSRSSVS